MGDSPVGGRTGRVVFVGSDLIARSRLRSAAEAAGFEFAAVPDAEGPALTDADTVVIDLDAAGSAGLAELVAGLGAPGRLVGFFSHVDEALGGAAAAAGIEAYPRGRFWRETAEIIGSPGRSGRQSPSG